MKKTIGYARKNIERNNCLWAHPIAVKLQLHHHNLAVEWAIQCIKIYSEKMKPGNYYGLDIFVEKAVEEQNHNNLSASECSDIGQEIWNLTGRDEFQTAIARLWWSIANFKDSHEDNGIMEVISVVDLLLPDKSHYLLDAYLKSAIKISEENDP
jgi:hypothetical protein